MFGFMNDLAISHGEAFGIYLIAGLVLFHDMKRIRWYALASVWLATGTFDRGFLIETTMLGFTYLLVESFFSTYYKHERAKVLAKAAKK